MPVVRTRALVLHSFPYGDTSRILRMLTPDYGLRSLIAKGARRPGSRFGALLEPFSEGEAQFNLRDGADLFTLTGFSLLRSRQGIGHDLTAFAGASLLAEVALRFGTEEGNPDLYDLLIQSLDRLADPVISGGTTTIQALWALISNLGYQPEMTFCVRCGRPVEPHEPSSFHAAAGGIVCAGCSPGGRMPGGIRAEVAAMAAGLDWELTTSEPARHADLLGKFLLEHLASDRPLRSFPLFRAQLS